MGGGSRVDKKGTAPQAWWGRRVDAMLLSLVALLALPEEQQTLAAESEASERKTYPTWDLALNVTYPLLAVNTADLYQDSVARVVKAAVGVGIYNVDFHMGEEALGVGKAIESLGRDALFLTTKLDKPDPLITNPVVARDLAYSQIEGVLSDIGNYSVDMLILKDSPSCPVMQAQWAVLEEYLSKGKAKVLGTYNFCEFSLDCILMNASVGKEPKVNYLMRHVGMGPDATGIIAYSLSKGIKTAAYGTLGEPVALNELLMDRTMRDIAEKNNRSVEEVALKWNAQAGHAITTRITSDYAPDYAPGTPCSHPWGASSVRAGLTDDCKASIDAMTDVYDWDLDDEDVNQLDLLEFNTYPQSPTYYSSTGCPASYSVVKHPNMSACAAFKPRYASTWC